MWQWIKYCKAAALGAFLLPFLTVSCQGQHIASPRGVQLLIGTMTVSEPGGRTETLSGYPNVILWLAVAVIVAGLIFAFRHEAEEKAVRMIKILSGAGVFLLVAGTIWINGSTIAASAGNSGNRSGSMAGFDSVGRSMASSMIRVDYAFGFWLALLALGAAAFLAWQSGLPDSGEGLRSQVRQRLGQALEGGDISDTSAWDRLTNKDDPDQLQEYLIRHPSGRFAELARLKLARMNVEPLVPTTQPPLSETVESPVPVEVEHVPPNRTCPTCGHRHGPDLIFCPRDGTELV